MVHSLTDIHVILASLNVTSIGTHVAQSAVVQGCEAEGIAEKGSGFMDLSDLIDWGFLV